MNLKKIKEVIDNELWPDNIKENAILSILSQDDKTIPYMLEIIEEQNKIKKELLLDTNVELSRAFVFIEQPGICKKKFVTDNIRKHYLKWQDKIKCCFKMKGLP